MGRLSARQAASFLGGSLAIGVFNAFNNFTLSLWLTGFTTSYVLISLLGNSRSLEGALVSPLTGLWSDRVWLGWLGRRRPFILAGGLLAALLLALTPAISRLPPPATLLGLPADWLKLAPLVLAVFLFTLVFNLADDVHKALLADLTDGAEQNRLSSFSVVVDIGGQVGILVLGGLLWQTHVPDSAFALAAAIVVAGVLLTVLGVREPPPAVWAEQRHVPAASGAGPGHPGHPGRPGRPPLRALLSTYRGALVFCLVTFAYWSGVNAVLPLVSIYTRDILGATVGEAQLLPALLLLSTTLLAIPMGWLGTRFGKRRVIGTGYAIMGLAALAGLVITTREQGAVVFLLAGIGNAATIVLAIPLMADLVPRQHMGLAAGALAGASSVAAPLASLVAGGLAQVYGPRAIFAVMAAMTCAALVLLLGVRTPPGHDEPEPTPASASAGTPA